MKERAAKEYREAVVTKIEQINDCYYILETEQTCQAPLPGQFYLLKPVNESSSLLHIPVSIYNIENSQLQFMIKVIGKGTRSLIDLQQGDRIKILGPLGNGFSIPEGKRILLVSGGIGYAPLYLLKKHLLDAQNEVIWLHGGRTIQDTFPAEIIYTEDCSTGEKGLVTQGLNKLLYDKNESYDMIFCCGPHLMMREVSRIAGQKQIPVEVSLEEYMACGLGACHGCVVKIRENEVEEYQTVCKDGPVFRAEKVVWDE